MDSRNHDTGGQSQIIFQRKHHVCDFPPPILKLNYFSNTANMPRCPRLNLAGMPLHLVQRGNNRSACFFTDEDYRFYLHWLSLYAHQYGCAIHAYVLMTNHVHLLLTPTKADAPAKLMQSLGRRYVQYINKFYKRSGTLWEGRYKASVVNADEYLLACYRYIELNPVRAGMVEHPREYVWSSNAANAAGQSNPLLKPHAIYIDLDRDEKKRQAAYDDLFRIELDPEVLIAIRTATNKGKVLGNVRFKAEIAAMTGRRVDSARPGRKRKEAGKSKDGEQMGLAF